MTQIGVKDGGAPSAHNDASTAHRPVDVLKRVLVMMVKFGAPLAIIAWLLLNLEPSTVERLRDREKNWGVLMLGFGLAFVAVCMTFVRWHMLVVALGLKFRMLDAFRLGFIGFLLSFVSVGSVGGDLFKAVFIAREQAGRRTEAVATVVVDRIVGLYALLILTVAALLLVDLSGAGPEVAAIRKLTFVFAGLGAIALLPLFFPSLLDGWLSQRMKRLPKVGSTFERLIEAVRMYRAQPATLIGAGAISLATHASFAVSIYLIGIALYDSAPTFGEHFVIVPLSLVAGALPFTPAGLGTFEFAMEKLYELIPATAHAASGVLVALSYRIVTILIAALGMVFYWVGRREVQAVMTEAEASA